MRHREGFQLRTRHHYNEILPCSSTLNHITYLVIDRREEE